MAIIKCPECGKEISDNAFSCAGCGFPLRPCYYPQPKKIIPGKGLGIAGMVLGIIGTFYSPMTISIFIANINKTTSKIGIPASIYISIFGILALTFGICSRRKGYKAGKSAAAIVLGCITLAFCITSIMLSLFY